MSQTSSSGWLLLLVLSLLFSLVMGLALVWLSGQLEERIVLKAKLEIERDRLLSPHILGRKAEELGMREARPGQIRKLPDPAGDSPAGWEKKSEQPGRSH